MKRDMSSMEHRTKLVDKEVRRQKRERKRAANMVRVGDMGIADVAIGRDDVMVDPLADCEVGRNYEDGDLFGSNIMGGLWRK